MRMSNQKTKLLHPHYFFRKMAYPISNRISTPMVAKMPHTNSGINIYALLFQNVIAVSLSVYFFVSLPQQEVFLHLGVQSVPFGICGFDTNSASPPQKWQGNK